MKARLDSVIKSLSVANAAIKNTASPVEKEGWFPTFSASGQDVWLPEYRFNLRGIVVSAVGARCGKAFKADGKWNVCANTHALSVDESIADRDYCWYMLNNEKWWIKGGTAQPFVKVKDSLKREHVFPTLSDQKRIVKQLDQICYVIELRQQQITALDDLIKARFVEMFGDPEKNEFGWEKVSINTVVRGKASNGYFAKREEYVDDGNVAVLGVAYVVNRMYSQVEGLPRTNATSTDIQKHQVKYGDMLFCRSSLVAEGIGKASIVPENTPENTLFECHVIRLPLDLKKCVPEFIQVLSTTDYFRKQIISQSKTATMTTIGQDGILKSTIILPPLEKQREFYAFVKQVDKSKVVVQKALDEAQLLFDSLMQQYFG